jgi:beta-glucanase (GH16 family)
MTTSPFFTSFFRKTFLFSVCALLHACGGGAQQPLEQAPTPKYNIGGVLTGLNSGQTLMLMNNGTEELVLNENSSEFLFPTALTSGSVYSVTIESQPADQTCTISNNVGTLSDVHITNIQVSCISNTYSIGGEISGLVKGNELVLLNNGADSLILNGEENLFTFAEKMTKGSSYNVTVGTQPKNKTCTVNNSTGVMTDSNITDIQVICSDIKFTVSGKVTGLSSGKRLILNNNNTDDLEISANTGFVFPTAIALNGNYDISVKEHPEGQVCSVSNPAGKNISKNITTLAVVCSAAPTPAKGLKLTWQDEFNHAEINPKVWSVANSARDQAWRSPKSVNLVNGSLDLRVFNKPDSATHYSGFIQTQNKFDFKYGYIEAKIKFKTQPGQWSAFWLMSPGAHVVNNPEDPAKGTEIDIVEHRGYDKDDYFYGLGFDTNVHWNGYGAEHKSYGKRWGDADTENGDPYEWNVYGLRWTPTQYIFYFNNREYFRSTRAVSNSNQFIMLTNEVKNNSWAGKIPTGGYGDFGDGIYNGWMQVDWVRLWQ